MITVTDCERVQTGWFRLRAEVLDGIVWDDDGLLWTGGPDGVNLMFPTRLSTSALQRGLDRVHRLGGRTVGVWLGLDVDDGPLRTLGFERGWSPWWMAADLDDVPKVADPRVRLEQESHDYRGEYEPYGRHLALTRATPTRAWYAAAHVGPRGSFAGRAWSYLDGDVAGVFDMDVWPQFRRHGLGTALLATVCAAAHRAGARTAVLNATPEGKLLYERCGFRPVGEGITWWHHGAPG